MHGIYRLKQEKEVLICWRQVTNRYEKHDADCTITHLATKTRKSICIRPTVIKVFDRLSRVFSVKHTSCSWRNGKATCLILLTRHCSFFIQKNLFHCKIHFAWYKINVCFSFLVICGIADWKGLIQFKNFNNASQFSKLNFRLLNIFSITCHSKNAWWV